MSAVIDYPLARFLSLILLCSFALNSQSREVEPTRTFILKRTVQTYSVWREIPRWDAGLLVGYEGNHSKGPVIYTLDREGRRDDTLFTFDNTAGINIGMYGAVASPSGESAVIGSAYTSAPFTTFIAQISADRKNQIVTRVWPYCPMAVTFAPDETLWTVGHLKDENDTREIAYSVLRRFDAAGKLLSSANLRAKSRADGGITYLRASRDRVGWFTDKNEYIESLLMDRNVRGTKGLLDVTRVHPETIDTRLPAWH
jgi:hypothetical protein